MSLFFASWVLQFKLLSRSPFFLGMATLTPIAFGTIVAIQSLESSGQQAWRTVLGATIVGAWSTTLFGAAESLYMQRYSGTLGNLLGAPRGLILPVLGFSAANVCLAVYSFAASLLWVSLVFGMPTFQGELRVAVLAMLTALFGLVGMGVFFAALYVVSRQAMELTNLLEYPLWLLSGIFFPLATLWPPLQAIGRLLPVTWAVDALYSTGGDFPWGGLLVSVALGAVYLALGFIGVQLIDKRSRAKGAYNLQ